VAQRDSTRLGQGSAGTPKPDIHPCTLARLRGAAPRTVGTTPVPGLPQQLVSGNERATTTRPPSIVVWLVRSVKDIAPPHELASDEAHNLAHDRTTGIACASQRNTRAYVGSGSWTALKLRVRLSRMLLGQQTLTGMPGRALPCHNRPFQECPHRAGSTSVTGHLNVTVFAPPCSHGHPSIDDRRPKLSVKPAGYSTPPQASNSSGMTQSGPG